MCSSSAMRRMRLFGAGSMLGASSGVAPLLEGSEPTGLTVVVMPYSSA